MNTLLDQAAHSTSTHSATPVARNLQFGTSRTFTLPTTGVFYGTDLAEYINCEFSDSGRHISADWTPPPMVAFWSDFLT